MRRFDAQVKACRRKVWEARRRLVRLHRLRPQARRPRARLGRLQAASCSRPPPPVRCRRSRTCSRSCSSSQRQGLWVGCWVALPHHNRLAPFQAQPASR